MPGTYKSWEFNVIGEFHIPRTKHNLSDEEAEYFFKIFTTLDIHQFCSWITMHLRYAVVICKTEVPIPY